MKFNLSEFVMFSYKTSIGERSFSSITSDLLVDLRFAYLDEKSRVACNSGETETRKQLLLFGRDTLAQNPATSVARVTGHFANESFRQ